MELKFKVHYKSGRIDEYSDERFTASRLFPGESDICTVFSIQERKPQDGIWVDIDYYSISQLQKVKGHSDRIPKLAFGYEMQVVNASELEDVVRVEADGEPIWLRTSGGETVDIARLNAQHELICGSNTLDGAYEKAAQIWRKTTEDAAVQDADESRKYDELAEKIGMTPGALAEAVKWAEERDRQEEDEELRYGL